MLTYVACWTLATEKRQNTGLIYLHVFNCMCDVALCFCHSIHRSATKHCHRSSIKKYHDMFENIRVSKVWYLWYMADIFCIFIFSKFCVNVMPNKLTTKKNAFITQCLYQCQYCHLYLTIYMFRLVGIILMLSAMLCLAYFCSVWFVVGLLPTCMQHVLAQSD